MLTDGVVEDVDEEGEDEGDAGEGAEEKEEEEEEEVEEKALPWTGLKTLPVCGSITMRLAAPCIAWLDCMAVSTWPHGH